MKKPIKELRSIFEKNNIHSIIEKNNQKMLDANFWLDKQKSQKIIKEKKLYEDLINSYNYSVKTIKELDELNQLALEEKNQLVIDEVLQSTKKLKIFSKKK